MLDNNSNPLAIAQKIAMLLGVASSLIPSIVFIKAMELPYEGDDFVSTYPWIAKMLKNDPERVKIFRVLNENVIIGLSGLVEALKAIESQNSQWVEKDKLAETPIALPAAGTVSVGEEIFKAIINERK